MDKNITPWKIDINCDLGECLNGDHLSLERKLMPLISSCSIACGGHAGDHESMSKVMEEALKHNVLIGAHPSYPDKANFGRSWIDITQEDLFISLINQISSLHKIANQQGATIHHVKPHGALYNQAAIDYEVSAVIIKAIKYLDIQTKIFCLPDSATEKLALLEGVEVVREGFVDRKYNEQGRLMARSDKQAVIEKEEEAVDQFLLMVTQGKVLTLDKNAIPMKVDTICVHGDNSNAEKILRACHFAAQNNNIQIGAYGRD